MPNSGVIYLNVGHKHLNMLVVSLMSLRDRYDGPVAILSGGDESTSFLNKYVVPDIRLDVKLFPFTYSRAGKTGSVYYAKTAMGEMSPFDTTVFVDADTLFVGDFSPVFPVDDEMVLTQFANWTTLSRRIQSRISKWSAILPKQVETQMKQAHPAINTGVLGFSKKTVAFMDKWRTVTRKNVGFICDEICAQLIYTEFPHRVLDERFNASPVFSWKRHGPHIPKADPRILHGHGKKFLKTEPEVQQAFWLPYYRRALQDNVAGIRGWTNDRRRYGGLVRPRKYIADEQWQQVIEGIDV